MSQKKRPPSKNKKPSSKPGHHTFVESVLETDGSKTSGLKANKSINVKEVGNYQVKEKSGLASHLEQEKEKAAIKRELMENLHPGWAAPDGADFTGVSLINRDLERMRFKNSLMKRCKFRASKLRGVHWKNCDLRGADFRQADLRDCILDGCNLNGADLRHANLTNARIIDTDLSAANFDHAILDTAMIESCDMAAQTFHNSSCQKIRLYNSQIIHGFFDNTDFTKSEIQDMEFRHCTLTKTSFNSADISNTSFKGCESFDEGPSFSHAKISEVTMSDCDLQSVNLANTQITACLWERVNLSDAQLDNTVFSQVNFSEGFFTDCFSVEKAPTFNHCRLDHLVIEHTDLTNALFSKSRFIGATIRDSDFEEWHLEQTGVDAETVIENYE